MPHKPSLEFRNCSASSIIKFDNENNNFCKAVKITLKKKLFLVEESLELYNVI